MSNSIAASCARSCPQALQRSRLHPPLGGARHRGLRHPDGRRRRRVAGLRRSAAAPSISVWSALQFLPLLLLALPAGQLADHVSRQARPGTGDRDQQRWSRSCCSRSRSTGAHPALALPRAGGGQPEVAQAIGLAGGPRTRSDARAVGSCLPSALALRSIAFQSGTVAGPALGGSSSASIRSSPTASRQSCSRPERSRCSWSTSRRSSGPARRRGWRLPGRHPLHPSHPRHARGDHARPVCGAVRRCDRAAAPLRARDPPHRAPRARRAPERPRRRRAARRSRDDAQARRRPYRDDALLVVGAFGVATIVFGLSKSLPLSARRSRGRRRRRHGQREHPQHDRGRRRARTSSAGG